MCGIVGYVFCLQNGWTPLHFAAQSGHILVVEALIAAGADVNAFNEVYSYVLKLYLLCFLIPY